MTSVPTLRDESGHPTSRSMVQYQNFFPAWDFFLRQRLEKECREPLANYMDPAFPDMRISYQVLDCLLRQFPEFRKAELSASAVVLGFIPTLLQLLSPSPTETASLALRRPLLAMLLAAAMPSARPLARHDHVGDALQVSRPLPPWMDARFPFGGLDAYSSLVPWARAVVSGAQYLLACAAVANTSYRTYQLCVWTVCTFVPTLAYFPAVWHLAVVLIHLIAWAVASVRVRSPRRDYGFCAMRWLRIELVPSAWAKRFTLESRHQGGGLEYVLVAVEFLLYFMIPMQILYGTIVLSGLVFVSVMDAVVIATWYMLSTVVCRAILWYEIAGMRYAMHQRR
ncbi:hypothetical protein CDD80_5982 [Ophiocordyceps camponoti-rufipedis]|uniref:Uncharacterized protein n=1 Tax=Ophiocordyceps camponoti-rufipedis TaxID=2004952 RepID=A0A2C5ZGN4_9HYPO|nr:hypothetical protein CDD80_5982 [Ophiocordyceps camponoti-rufipedis]